VSLPGRSKPEKLLFYAEECAQLPGEEMCVEGGKEGSGHFLEFLLWAIH
jgi:hypothetical protein